MVKSAFYAEDLRFNPGISQATSGRKDFCQQNQYWDTWTIRLNMGKVCSYLNWKGTYGVSLNSGILSESCVCLLFSSMILCTLGKPFFTFQTFVVSGMRKPSTGSLIQIFFPQVHCLPRNVCVYNLGRGRPASLIMLIFCCVFHPPHETDKTFHSVWEGQ